MKKEFDILMILFLSLFSINFASASLSLSDIFQQIDPSTILLFVAFIVSFALIFFGLLKFFNRGKNSEKNKGMNQTIAAIIAGALSLLIVYELSTMNLSLETIFSDIGISAEALPLIIGAIIILSAVFLIIKLKAKSLFIFGGVLILLGIVAYEKTIPIVLGIVLIFVGLFIISIGKKKTTPQTPHP